MLPARLPIHHKLLIAQEKKAYLVTEDVRYHWEPKENYKPMIY